MSKKILVIGGGVAGCSCGHFLTRKGYEVTILERNDYLGGMSATFSYAGHPYEFGPHVWFWPNDNINDVIRELTNDRIYEVERKLYTFTGESLYRYPIHFSDIEQMPDREKVLAELRQNRDENLKLIPSQLPTLGECTFAEYFTAAIGPTLYQRFMAGYTRKMWDIPGDVLDTKLVWADRIKNNYEETPAYDPVKFEDHVLGKGLPNWYPMDGWNVVWNGMTQNCEVHLSAAIDRIESRDGGGGYRIIVDEKGRKVEYNPSDYHAVINTIHTDELWGEYVLPANGRLIIPQLIPGLDWAFPDEAESIHYSDDIALTRTTEMKRITRHDSPDTLILLEVPVTDKSQATFPENIMNSKHYHPRCYNRQTDQARGAHEEFVSRTDKIGNVFQCGRHAKFKYWGMPEVVNDAFELAKEF